MSLRSQSCVVNACFDVHVSDQRRLPGFEFGTHGELWVVCVCVYYTIEASPAAISAPCAAPTTMCSMVLTYPGGHSVDLCDVIH